MLGNKLEESERVSVSTEDLTELVDLLALVLLKGGKVLLKRGIDKNYVDYKNEISGIKGKLSVTETIQGNLLSKYKTICTYDEFSSDILTNQILVSTLRNLLRVKNLDSDIKNKIYLIIKQFPRITYIKIKAGDFKRVRLHRNNRFYDFILKICELIYENLLPAEQEGDYKFMDFTRDEVKMRALFEHFLFNFYSVELNKYRVKRDNIKWQLLGVDEHSKEMLPIMRTDISLRGENEKIIIDAKYYRKSLNTNFNKDKVRSTNLYQIFSYLINQENENEPLSMSARGILLYPSNGYELDLSYDYKLHTVQIKTVDLSKSWQEIRERLIEIVKT